MIDQAITKELRDLASSGCRPSELLRHVAAREKMSRTTNALLLVDHLKAAFGLSLRDVHLVCGWNLKGEGEVPDSRIDAVLGEKIQGWVRSHDVDRQQQPFSNGDLVPPGTSQITTGLVACPGGDQTNAGRGHVGMLEGLVTIAESNREEKDVAQT